MKKITIRNYNQKMYKKIDELLKAHHFEKCRDAKRYIKPLCGCDCFIHIKVISGYLNREGRSYWCSPLKITWTFSQMYNPLDKKQRTRQNKLLHKYNKILIGINEEIEKYGQEIREKSNWYCEQIAENV